MKISKANFRFVYADSLIYFQLHKLTNLKTKINNLSITDKIVLIIKTFSIGNILGWGALNHMLKREGVYEEYCFDEITFASNLNQTYLLSNLDNHPLNNSSHLSRITSAKFNETLLNLPDFTTTEPSLNLSMIDLTPDTEPEWEEEKNDPNLLNNEETTTQTDLAEDNENVNSDSIRVSSRTKPSIQTSTTPSLVRAKRDSENRTTNQVNLIFIALFKCLNDKKQITFRHT